MSDLPPKADVCGALARVCNGPIADITGLFDQLVGTSRQWKWDSNAERPGGLQVNDQFNFANLLDREVGGLVTLENPFGIDAGQAVSVGNVRSVTHQTSGRSKLAILENCRHGVAKRQRAKLFANAREERAGADNEPTRLQLEQPGENYIQVRFAAGIEDMELQPQSACSRQRFLHHGFHNRRLGRVDEKRQRRAARKEFAQQLKPLWHYFQV